MLSNFKGAMNENIKLLRKAKRLIKNGWCQHSYAETPNGPTFNWADPAATNFCAMGAIFKSRPDGISDNDICNVLEKLVYRIDKSTSVAVFNDEPGRTKEDIINLFTKAEKLL